MGQNYLARVKEQSISWQNKPDTKNDPLRIKNLDDLQYKVYWRNMCTPLANHRLCTRY